MAPSSMASSAEVSNVTGFFLAFIRLGSEG